MKQRITAEQLAELTDAQKENLREWWVPEVGDVFIIPYSVAEDIVQGYDGEWISAFDARGRTSYKKRYCTPRLSIGQCLKLLMDIGIVQTTICIRDKVEGIYQKADVSCWDKDYHNKDAYRGKGEELIDVLWQLIWR